MNESMIIKEQVLLQSTLEKVWDLLVNPAMTKQYMFGCEVISDWAIDSPVYWKGETENGEKVVYVKGKILAFDKGKRISSTTFDPNSGMADIPANHVTLTYELEERDDGILLTITQGDFSEAQDGKKRYEESKEGWKAMVIPTIKKLLE